ncbi:MAG: hypothetical protein ACYSWX_09480 [Planctomycetota bacterium]
MTKKQDLIARFLDEYQPRWKVPEKPIEGFDLLEHGMMLILNEHLTPNQAEATVKALRAADQDWNELRVSQSQEIAQFVRTSSRKTGTELLFERKPVSLAIKDYLQDVFQQTHGLTLEYLREDLSEHSKLLSDFKVLGMTGGSYVFWLAADGHVPVHLGLVKILDKLGFCGKTTSIKKAQEMIAPIVPTGRELEFTLAFHELLETWADEENPPFAKYATLRETAYGKKAHADWESARARASAAQAREEERLRKEQERLEREAERERKRLEAAAKKAQAAEERKRAVEQRKREAAERKARLEAEKKAKAEAAKKAKEAAAKKAKAEAERKAKAAKKAKEAAAKKAAKKATAKKTAKKAAAKRVTKKAPVKKAAPKKAAAKKAAKKTTAKKVTKKAAKKTAAKKATKKAAKKTKTRR